MSAAFWGWSVRSSRYVVLHAPQGEKEDRRKDIARRDAHTTQMVGHPASVHDGALRMLNGGLGTIKH